MTRKCITCGRSCSQMLKSDNYAFCCLCLPKQYYTKPQKEWICEACLKRQSNRKRHTTNRLASKGRIICHLERYYDLSKRANYAPDLVRKIENITPLQGEILDDLIEAGFKTSVSIEPFLSDPLPTIEMVILLVTDTIWIGPMSNPLPELKELYTYKSLSEIYNRLTHHPAASIIRLKNSYRKKLGIKEDEKR